MKAKGLLILLIVVAIGGFFLYQRGMLPTEKTKQFITEKVKKTAKKAEGAVGVVGSLAKNGTKAFVNFLSSLKPVKKGNQNQIKLAQRKKETVVKWQPAKQIPEQQPPANHTNNNRVNNNGFNLFQFKSNENRENVDLSNLLYAPTPMDTDGVIRLVYDRNTYAGNNIFVAFEKLKASLRRLGNNN
ncbi:MAG: hypothetical protein D6780_05570, partial [Candidatus Dadabacteria bacterium]